MMTYPHHIWLSLAPEDVWRQVKVQLLQSLSMLIQNIRRCGKGSNVSRCPQLKGWEEWSLLGLCYMYDHYDIYI